MQRKEHYIQKSFFEWLKYQHPKLIKEKAIYAIPNGGHRNIITASLLKQEGVTAGVFDVCLDMNNKSNTKYALYIEFKFGKNKLTEEQKIFMENSIKRGRECKVCYTIENAIECITNYLNS